VERRRVVCIIVIFLILTILQPVFTAETIQYTPEKKANIKLEIIDGDTKKILKTMTSETNDDTIIFHWPNENSAYPWNQFKVPIFAIGLENYEKVWDTAGNRNCWEYKQRLMWWSSSLNINGEYTDDPYYDFDVYYWPEIEEGCWEGESFMFGGWNVEEAEYPGDYSDWSSLLATLLLFPFFAFPVKNFPVVRADGILSLLCEIEEDIQPTYAWDGSNIFDASGCFEHDFHVYADTDFSKIFWFRFAFTPGDPFEKTLGIRFSGTSPDPPPELELTPESQNFGDIKVGEESQSYSFTLENNGLTSQYVEVYLTNGVKNHWEITQGSGSYPIDAGNTETIKVKFKPENKGIADIELRVSYPGGHLSSNLYGNGLSKSSYKLMVKNPVLIKFRTIFINSFKAGICIQ